MPKQSEMWETDKFQAGLKFVIKGGVSYYVSAFWNGQPDAYIGHVLYCYGIKVMPPSRKLATVRGYEFNYLAINSTTTAVAGKAGFTLASAATAVAKWSELCCLR